MATETCEPPEEHKGKRWHLLRLAYMPGLPGEEWYDDRPTVWADGFWQWHTPTTGEEAYRLGWRYVGPAIPPAVEEG